MQRLPGPVAALMTAPRPYLTDGGFETSMVFHEGLDLPAFSAVVLMDDDRSRAAVTRYFERFLAIAEKEGDLHSRQRQSQSWQTSSMKSTRNDYVSMAWKFSKASLLPI